MRKFLSVIVTMFILAVSANQANAQCPSGSLIQVRFANLDVNCSNDSLFVDIQVANPTAASYSVGSMSLRFTYNTSMLSNPRIKTQTMAGTHSLQVQNSIWSYGLIELSTANVLPAGGTWRTVGTIAFHINSFNAGGNADCLDLTWNTTAPAITTAQQFVSFTCQPSLLFSSYGNNTTCIADSCSPAAPMSLSAAATNVTCTGTNNGTIDLTVTGGTAPYTYLWNNGAVTQDLSGLSAGSYSVTVTDATGATAIESGISVGSASLTVNANVSDARCNASDDGSITLSVSGGSGPFTYVWNDGATTQNRSNLLPGTYSVTVTGAGGCTGTATNLVVGEPGPFIYNVNPLINVSCFGGNDGSLDFSVTGGTPPFAYQWTEYDLNTFLPIANLGNSEDLAGLHAGLYGVEVTDANGCTGAVFYLISQPSPIVISGTVTNASCFGSRDGDISVSVTGGTTPYLSYTWSSPTYPGFSAASLSLDNELAGTYILEVRDINNCTARDTFVIGQPTQITATLGTATNVTCFGLSNGAIDLNVAGGNPPYTYRWSNNATTQDLTGIAAGTYTVTVTDSRSCTAVSAPITISQPADIVLTATTDSVDCFGQSNGSIDLSVAGGTGTYTYLWTPGNFTTQDIANLAAGTYKVVVTDGNGCRDSLTSVSVGQPVDLAIVVNSVGDVACAGASTGAIDISVTGGSPAYTYRWSNGALTQDLSNLAAGIYRVTVTDGKGCTDSASVTVNEVPALTINLGGVTNVSCFGGNNGAIDISITGGTAPYTYAWTGGSTTQDITGLTAGSYSVTVTDSRGCTRSATYQVAQPTQLVATVTTHTDVTCFGAANGALDVTVSGGTAPYTYLWTPGGARTQDTTGLRAGIYSLLVTDANGCSVTVRDTIREAGLLVINLDGSTNVSCFGGSNGSINIGIVGGSAPYTYIWSNNATTQDITGLTAGTYAVTVTDVNGCIANNSFTITQPAVLVASVSSTTNVSCFGASTGAIDVTVVGGTSPYTYAWTGGATTQDLSGLAAGTYTVTVTDANGCIDTAQATITQSPQLVISLDGTTNVACFGQSNGALNISVTGGVPGYTYSWSNGATTQDVSGLAAGSYGVTITDAAGCTVSGSYTVSQPAVLVASIANTTNASCFGAANGAIDVAVTGGTAPYTYLWTPGGATTQDTSGLTSGEYTVVVTDANGCTATVTDTIFQSGQLSIDALAITNVSCFGGNDGAIDVTISGGTLPYTYVWSNGATTEDISGLSAGSYTITVTDSNGCVASATFNVGQPAQLVASIDSVVTVTCFGAATGAIDIDITGGTAPYTFAWSNQATTEDISALIAGTYTVTVVDANGCRDTLDVTVNQLPQLVITLDGIDSVACYGQSNGAINITVTGGTTAYTYAWSNQATTEDVTGLSAGTYTVTVTDANACSASATYTVSQPDTFVVIVDTVFNANCSGDAVGAIDISVAGGNAPYTYLWSNGAPVQDAIEVTDGVYTVTVTDAKGCTATATITVVRDNCPPVARNDFSNTLMNVPVSGDVSTNDFDPDGDALTFTQLTTTGNGTVTGFNPATGTYTYTPNTNFVGNDSFTYQVCDNGTPSLCDTATVYIEVVNDPKDPFNNPPVANTDHFITYTDVPFSSTVINNDFDPDTADAITVNPSLVTPPSNGTITIGTDGSFTYVPNAGFEGEDTLVYQLCDNGTPGPLCDTAVVVITVLNDGGQDNLPPVAVDDAYYTELNTPVGGNVLINDFDPDSNVITVNVPQQSGPSNGTVVINSNGTFTYTPNTGYVGPDEFVYTICDNGVPSLCDTATVHILIQNPANQPPLARNDINNTLLNTPVSGDVSTNDEEPDGDNVTFTQLTPSANGIVTSFDPATGTYTYVPNTGFIGNDSFTYSICDNGTPSLCDTATVTITVVPPFNFVNNPPVANPDDFVTYANTSVSGTVIPNDFDPDTADVISVGTTLVTGPSNGTVTSINSDGTFTYVPNTGFTGEDTFVYTLCDNGNPALCDTALVTIHVLPTTVSNNLPPVAVDDAYITSVGVAVSGNVQDNDYDLDGNSIVTNVPQLSGPSNGTVVINPDGSFTYTPNAGFTGTDQFVYSICDNGVPSLCDTATVYITIYDVMRLVLVPTDASCNGDSTGSIDLTVVNGNAPFTYLWSNGATTEDLTNVPAGTYSVTVTDAFGVSLVDSATVNQPLSLTASANATPVLCAGGSNGAIDITVAGGTAPFTYTWSNGATSEDVNSLVEGLYSVNVIDANGCRAQLTASVGTENTLVLNTGITNAVCGGANGVATVSVSGGDAPYTYNWGAQGTNATISNLTAGVYVVTVTDGNGCSAVDSAAVSNVTPMNIAATVNDGRCGIPSGSVTLTVAGGTAPYTYAWSNGAGNVSAIQGLVAGSYSATVTDSTGCSEVIVVNVGEISGLLISQQVTPASCGQADGIAQLNISGGTAPYTINWSNGGTGNILSGFAAGLYQATITDAAGCSTIESVVIGNIGGPAITIDSIADITCANSSTGSISISVAGGTAPYTYAWSNGGQTASISGLISGPYAVTVTDANGCVAVADASVGTATEILVVADMDSVGCNGAANGAIDLTVSGGAGGYTFAWSGSAATTEDLSGLSAGQYSVTVTDANGCSVSTPVVVAQPAPLVATVDSITHVACNTDSTGAVAVSIAGGTAPYTYAWSNGATTQDIASLPAGNYVLTVTDANGCTAVTASATVNGASQLSITVSSVDTIDCYGQTGAITVAVNGGVAPFVYNWSPNVSNTATAANLGAGTYAVYASDANGCLTDTAVIVLTQPDSLSANIGTTIGACAGYSDGEIRIKAVFGGTAPYTYEWSNDSTGAVVSGLSAGTYAVTISDAKGCQIVQTVQLAPVAAITLTRNQQGACVNGLGSIDLTVGNGVAPFTFVWNTGATTEDIDSLIKGTYSVVVTDANGCSVADSFVVSCNQPPIAVDDTATTTSNTSVDIPVMVNDSDPDGDILSDPTIIDNPNNGTVNVNGSIVTYTPNQGFVGIDTFFYQICDDGIPNLCDTAMVIIIVLPDRPNVSIPDGFSPNGDEYNPTFEIPDIDKYPGSKLVIFNRWGNTVYESPAEGYDNKWDGTDMDGEMLPDGTYFYILEVNDGNKTTYNGFVTIQR
ncbi:MAG: Ig-like domain-containing protein [Chitinophagales bacterium]|nr:Ig-like domain-containing protein [Chitinophagales bacterium]